jgi:hypothetical protein
VQSYGRKFRTFRTSLNGSCGGGYQIGPVRSATDSTPADLENNNNNAKLLSEHWSLGHTNLTFKIPEDTSNPLFPYVMVFQSVRVFTCLRNVSNFTAPLRALALSILINSTHTRRDTHPGTLRRTFCFWRTFVEPITDFDQAGTVQSRGWLWSLHL